MSPAAPATSPIEVSDRAGLKGNHGRTVALVGRYAVVDTGRHRVLHQQADGTTRATSRVVRLVLGDGTAVDLWVRPDEELAALTDRTVVATGRLVLRATRPGPGAAPDPGPSLVDLQSIVAR